MEIEVFGQRLTIQVQQYGPEGSHRAFRAYADSYTLPGESTGIMYTPSHAGNTLESAVEALKASLRLREAQHQYDQALAASQHVTREVFPFFQFK